MFLLKWKYSEISCNLFYYIEFLNWMSFAKFLVPVLIDIWLPSYIWLEIEEYNKLFCFSNINIYRLWKTPTLVLIVWCLGKLLTKKDKKRVGLFGSEILIQLLNRSKIFLFPFSSQSFSLNSLKWCLFSDKNGLGKPPLVIKLPL